MMPIPNLANTMGQQMVLLVVSLLSDETRIAAALQGVKATKVAEQEVVVHGLLVLAAVGPVVVHAVVVQPEEDTSYGLRLGDGLQVLVASVVVRVEAANTVDACLLASALAAAADTFAGGEQVDWGNAQEVELGALLHVFAAVGDPAAMDSAWLVQSAAAILPWRACWLIFLQFWFYFEPCLCLDLSLCLCL